MKKRNIVFFSVANSITFIGFILYFLNIVGGNTLITLGLLLISIFYMLRSIDSIRKFGIKGFFSFNFLFVLIPFAFFTRYMYHKFFDIPSFILLVVLLFGIPIFFIQKRYKDKFLLFTMTFYFLLIFPLVFNNVTEKSMGFLPDDLSDKYDVSKSEVKSEIQGNFKSKKAYSYMIEATHLIDSKKYYEAYVNLLKVNKMEPKQVKVLKMISSTLAHQNQFAKAVDYLDSAILLDSSYAELYNNRAILHVRLKNYDKAINDYNTAISRDSSKGIYYANLALIYFYTKDYDEFCRLMTKAEEIGVSKELQLQILQAKKEYCN